MALQAYVALATLVTLAATQGLTVNTPTSVQACLPVAISWTGGVPPVYVSLIPGGQPGGSIVKDFGLQNSSPLTWQVDQPAGTSLSVQIRDSSGALNYSDKFEVQPSTANCSASSSPTKPGTAPAPVTTGTGKAGAANSSSSTNTSSSPSTPTSGSSTPTSGSTTPTSSNSSASGAASTPAAGASSDASKTIPAFCAIVLSAVTAVFA